MLDPLKEHRDLWDRFIKGRPQATDTYTVEELETMGMSGLYKEDDNDQAS